MQGVRTDASWGNFNALGLLRNGRLVCGVIYNSGEGANSNMHIGAIHGSKWLTPEFLFAAFDYPFNQLKKRRATAMIAAKNLAARRFAENLGFVYEGTLPHYYWNDDMICYGMLREHCRFLSMTENRKAADGR